MKDEFYCNLPVPGGLRCFIGGGDRYLRVSHPVGRYPWGETRWSEGEVLATFDPRRRDAAYWHSVKRFFEWLAPYCGGWTRSAYKQLRRAHHESFAKEWEDVLPKTLVAWAWAELRREAQDLYCCDNWRVARLGNTGQMRRYRRQKENGCCGFSDFERVGPDGKRYVLGFNFGH